ncbi:isocitrate lyase/PEP mutase family protein [Tissierella praeacuta]|uniref:isocitrate lyase/PEP mutase family protein n=1 Tax=Tissierella praeacuta TaxID=43131 RepID=UPI003518A64A
MSAGKMLKELLRKEGAIVAPGAYDAWSAKLVEISGFPCVYMTGYGVSASVLGKPDIGLITMTEMVNQLRNIVASVNIPVIADADNGYGGILNVVRTVEAYEQTGVAAIQLEDQVTPKRCGHMEGKEVISKEEMVSKIKAAIYARKDPNFMIIARTDARAVNSFEDAIDRAKAYEEAGADVIFFEAPQSIDEMKKIHKYITVPTLANMVEKGKTPLLTGKELGEIGYKIVIYPVSSLYCATKSILDMLAIIKETDTTKGALDKMIPFDTFNKMISLDELRNLERKLANN